MATLYVFAIGGTGSRVLRSVAMMLASGVDFNADKIVPIIIDPDQSNANLTETVELLNLYRKIRSKLTFTSENSNRFFRTEIGDVIPNYTLKIRDTNDKSLKGFINLPDMSRENQAMVRMLFSKDNLEDTMNVGFKGNPNIGSVVLNQIGTSDDFKEFTNSFSQGDRIFIVSSIFGGTGASGFPLLLKTLRKGTDFQQHDLINKAKIGALTILPYFKLKESTESKINSSSFISKTKSALAYYEENIANNQSIDALYFLSDPVTASYENHEGGTAQDNDAHQIEFMGATAIANFLTLDDEGKPLYFRLGVKDTKGTVTFKTLYNEQRNLLFTPLVQFTLMANALTYKKDFYSSKTFNANSVRFGDKFYYSGFFTDLTMFLESYKRWLEEMKGNEPRLDLFHLNCGEKPFDVVTDVKGSSGGLLSLKSGYDKISDKLNGAVRKCKSKEKEDQFLEMFYRATKELIEKQFEI